MPVAWVLVLSSFLFSVGIYGVLARRNAVLVLMSIELMLNAANINFVVFSVVCGKGSQTVPFGTAWDFDSTSRATSSATTTLNGG